MSKFHSNWRKFLTEGTFKEEKLLREVSEEEVEHIRKALDELGPEQLAFQHIFGEKNRLLIPFPTKDKKSPLGQFVDFFDSANYEVNWSKGIMFGTKEFNDTSPQAIMAMLGVVDRGMRMGGGPIEDEIGFSRVVTPKQKKIQMKIGKFFSKIDSLAKKIRKYQQIMLKATESGFDGDNVPVLSKRMSWHASWEELYNTGKMWRSLTGREIKSSLGDQEVDYYRLVDQLRGYLNSNIKLISQALKTEQPLAPVMAQYWQGNADFIKKNVDNLEVDSYSILVTRHPIDVLRMSDFEDIQSCHSPKSRGGMGEYYKCAVAEAHGHGALAYIVNTSDLEEEFGTRDIVAINNSSAFQENQDVFYDEARDAGGEIEPVARLRMRQVRYFENVNPKRHDEGVELAVPEQRVYGQDIPGFRKTLINWLVGVQKANAEAVAKPSLNPDKPDELLVNFKRMVKYGGSYEDTGAGDLVMDLFKKQFPGRDIEFYGGKYIDQNMETERELERNLDFGGEQALRDAADEGASEMKRFLGQNVQVEVDIEHDGDEPAAVPRARVYFYFSDAKTDFQRTVPLHMIDYVVQEIEDFYGSHGRGRNMLMRARYGGLGIERTPGNTIRVVLGVRFAAFNEGYYTAFVNPDELLETMSEAGETIGNRYEAFEMIIQRFLIREAYLQGSELLELGQEVESGEYRMSDWSVETEEGDYEPHEYELVSASLPCEIDFSNTTKDIAQRIVADRNFWIRIRGIITDKARQTIDDDEGYQVDYDRFVDEIDPVAKRIEIRLNFHVGEDDPDSQVLLFKAILEEWGDAETVEEVIQTEFNKFARAYNPENPQTISEGRLRLRNRSREERMFDKWRRFLK